MPNSALATKIENIPGKFDKEKFREIKKGKFGRLKKPPSTLEESLEVENSVPIPRKVLTSTTREVRINSEIKCGNLRNVLPDFT